MVNLESLLVAASLSSFQAFDNSLPGDAFTVVSSGDNSSGYFLNVSAYFENGTFYGWEAFPAINATSDLFVSYALFNIEDFIGDAPDQGPVDANCTGTSCPLRTAIADPNSLEKRARSNCGNFCGKTDHCQGPHKLCRGCRILQWATGLWQKHCVL